MTLVAGVDSSTQSCKVLVVEAETGRVVRAGRASHPAGTAVDPQAWWDALQAAIADAGGLEDVAAISVGGQQHGCVVLDADGQVIRDALLWNDNRSAGAAKQLRQEFGDEQYATRTGIVPVASFTATKLRWIKDNEPDNAKRVAAVALPHDWLTWRLRGYGPGAPQGVDLAALTTDRSDASGTAYFSSDSNEYDRELLILALGHDAILPRVAMPGEVVGTTVASDNVPAGLLVAVGAGDNAAAALGLGAKQGDVIVSIGTSGTAFATTSTPIADPSGTVAGFADADGGYLPLVATMNAAQVVDTFAALLGVSHEEFGELAESEPASESDPILLPYLAGERTPNLPNALGSLRGLSQVNTTREAIARAAINGMVCGLADGVAAIAGQGVALDRVILIGGGSKLTATRRSLARVLGMPISVPPAAEYVALGAARQAARIALGVSPQWRVEGEVTESQPHDPGIHERYAAAVADYISQGGAG